MTTELTQKTNTETMGLSYNGARDTTWSVSSWLGLSVGAQTFIATVPMVLLATGATIDLARQGKITTDSMKKVWTPVAAAAAAIPMWGLGVKVGTSLAGGVLGAVGAGVFEGFTQWSVKYLADVATNETTQEMWRRDPALMTKLLGKELLLNTTIGAVPGALWYAVYWGASTALLAAGCPPVAAILLTALLVATVVMSSNFTCGRMIDKTSSFIDELEWTKWDKARKELQEQIEKDLKSIMPPSSDSVPGIVLKEKFA